MAAQRCRMALGVGCRGQARVLSAERASSSAQIRSKRVEYIGPTALSTSTAARCGLAAVLSVMLPPSRRRCGAATLPPARRLPWRRAPSSPSVGSSRLPWLRFISFLAWMKLLSGDLGSLFCLMKLSSLPPRPSRRRMLLRWSFGRSPSPSAPPRLLRRPSCAVAGRLLLLKRTLFGRPSSLSTSSRLLRRKRRNEPCPKNADGPPRPLSGCCCCCCDGTSATAYLAAEGDTAGGGAG